MPGPSFVLSILDAELLGLTMSTEPTPMFALTDSASRPEISPFDRAGPVEMQTHQKCPPKWISPLQCTLTKNSIVGSSECPVTNSLNLNSPAIRASWPFGRAEVLSRSSAALTPLECTDTKNGLISSLECTDTNSLDLKFHGITLFQKKGGGYRLNYPGGIEHAQGARRTRPGQTIWRTVAPRPARLPRASDLPERARRGSSRPARL